jgi:acetoacetyl-[acyl-carrier protein] synthase
VTTITRLPVIVGFGGFNAAGRSSGHRGYERMIFESLSELEQTQLITSLANIMGEPVRAERGAALQRAVLQGTLVRRIENTYFAVGGTPVSKQFQAIGTDLNPIRLTISHRELPHPLPVGWRLVSQESGVCEIEVSGKQAVSIESLQEMPVQAAGQLPSGFDPGSYYRSTHHPRGLQLNILAASDAVRSIGIPWREVCDKVSPDHVAVYSSSVMSQLDNTGFGGMLQARLRGERVSSKQLALGLNTMPADFVNAYVLGSVGATGGVTGACATFLYNLRAGVEDIKTGRRRVVLVGSAEAPILPEIIDGYAAMSALATDADLRKLTGELEIDYRRASRPFGENCGFTLAESGQYVVLMDDALALEMGAQIFAAVPAVYVHADGFKKSISAPGPGNYITMARATALAANLLGEKRVQNASFVQAHGSSTPQNRVTESRIFDQVAKAFHITNWPVAAVKSYLGHSLGPASGDQMMATLGVFARGIVPGVKTIDAIAEDVHADRLQISLADQHLGAENCLIGLLNSKGFGGNNATATVISPLAVEPLLKKRHGTHVWNSYQDRRAPVAEAAGVYVREADAGRLHPIYEFGTGMVDEEAIEMDSQQIKIPGYHHPVNLTGYDGFDDLVG